MFPAAAMLVVGRPGGGGLAGAGLPATTVAFGKPGGGALAGQEFVFAAAAVPNAARSGGESLTNPKLATTVAFADTAELLPCFAIGSCFD